MDVRLNCSGPGTNYGSVAYKNETLFQHSGRVPIQTNTVSPENTGSNIQRALSVSDVTYVVKEYVGPWWRGACFRKTKRKTVLKNISLHVKAGEITAILGNSGMSKISLVSIQMNDINIYKSAFLLIVIVSTTIYENNYSFPLD